MKYNRNKNFGKKQKGATLFTALVFLIVMTVASVSASKMSLIDIIVAGNNQQRMQVFQSTDNHLKELSTVTKLFNPLVKTPGHKFNDTTGIYKLTDATKPHVTQQITDRKKRYQCGGFNDKAISIGPNVAPCDLYDFQVNETMNNTGVRERHNRGAGKEKPNSKKNSYL